MVMSLRFWLARLSRGPYRVIFPALAGVAMLGASLLPWLNDPLGTRFSAWQLPVDIGWQLRSPIFSYGVLCIISALYAFFVAFQGWRLLQKQAGSIPETRRAYTPTNGMQTRSRQCVLAALLCLLPLALFLTQYLYIDMGSIAQLSRDEVQGLLTKSQFGYGLAAQMIPIQPFTFDPLTLQGRLTLLLDQVGPGFFLPLGGVLLLLNTRRFFPRDLSRPTLSARRRSAILIGIAIIALMLLLGRGPAGMLSNFQAQHLLAEGDYADALNWLNTASQLNPSLNQLAGYHLERGHAWYFLHPNLPDDESEAYLASFYSQQADYLSSYQQLLAAWQQGSTSPWLQDQLDMTLTQLAEMSHPLHGDPTLRITVENASLTWLDDILRYDPSNVYAHYTIGRIRYDLHDYNGCSEQMLAVLALSNENNIQSSAYTYLGLSSAGRGDMVTARDYLFKAQDLDPEFRNNTDREEISGLR